MSSFLYYLCICERGGGYIGGKGKGERGSEGKIYWGKGERGGRERRRQGGNFNFHFLVAHLMKNIKYG